MTIKLWPDQDRPRERLFRNGEHSLSDTELLAVLLGSGSRGQSAVDLARKIIQQFGSFRKIGQADLGSWQEIRGLGQAKTARIKAAIEIGKRAAAEKSARERVKISCSRDAARILMPRMRDLRKEVFKILVLNSENVLKEVVEIEEGTVNEAFPIVREIFQKALQCFAASIICVHNHPSGNTDPSPQDKDFTKKAAAAGSVLQVKVLDHIIIGDNNFFSFLDAGLL